jgi:hypothetical protein
MKDCSKPSGVMACSKPSAFSMKEKLKHVQNRKFPLDRIK